MRKDKKLIVCLLSVALWLPLASAQLFTITDLGTSTQATGVNIAGQVVGQSSLPNDTSPAFLWTKNQGFLDLGTLGGDFSRPYHVNALAQVVGESALAGNLASHAFLWMQTQGMQDLGTLGGCESLAEGINLFGRVVGGSIVSGCDFSQFHGFLWTKAEGMKDIGTLGGDFSEAKAINAFGQVVGVSSLENESSDHAFLWTQRDGMQDLGALGNDCSSFSTASAINDQGHIVGETADCDGTEHAFLWTKATGMKDIGPAPGGFGGLTGINLFDQVVGSFCPEPCMGNEHAFIWTKKAGWLDLNGLIPAQSGWELVIPNDINEWGQIVGYGFINGEVHGFLLTPNIASH